MKKGTLTTFMIIVVLLLGIAGVIYFTNNENDAIQASLPPAEQTPFTADAVLTVETAPSDELLEQWIGNYVFYERISADHGVNYEFSIIKVENAYKAHFYIYGFQTLNEFEAILKGDEDSIDLVFDKYVDLNLSEPYKQGDVLLTFKKEQGSILTYWQKFQPIIKEHKSGEVLFGEKRCPKSGCQDSANKEATILNDTGLVNELENEKGLFYLGMSRNDLVAVLEAKEVYFICEESDTGSWIAYFSLFDECVDFSINENGVCNIVIRGSVPLKALSTQAGLYLGDSFEKMVELYGDDYRAFGDDTYRYYIDDHFFEVEFDSGGVTSWQIYY